MLTEGLWIEMVYIFIWFWGKNYLKKSSDLGFLVDFSDLSPFLLIFIFWKSTQKQFFWANGHGDWPNECFGQVSELLSFSLFLFYRVYYSQKDLVACVGPKELYYTIILYIFIVQKVIFKHPKELRLKFSCFSIFE